MMVSGDILIRPFYAADAPDFAQAVCESFASLSPWMPWSRADYTEADALHWFALCDAARANGSAHEMGIFRAGSGQLMGGVGINQIQLANKMANLGYWVRQSAQRQGIATRTVAAMVQFGFTTLDLHRLEIVVAVGNDASAAVAVKSGALLECVARNRLFLHGQPVAAQVFSLVPDTTALSRQSNH